MRLFFRFCRSLADDEFKKPILMYAPAPRKSSPGKPPGLQPGPNRGRVALQKSCGFANTKQYHIYRIPRLVVSIGKVKVGKVKVLEVRFENSTPRYRYEKVIQFDSARLLKSGSSSRTSVWIPDIFSSIVAWATQLGPGLCEAIIKTRSARVG